MHKIQSIHRVNIFSDHRPICQLKVCLVIEIERKSIKINKEISLKSGQREIELK